MSRQASPLQRRARLESAARTRSRRLGSTIAIASGKGGVGKSTIATSLALALAELGRETALVDGDFGLGSCDVLLGLTPERRIDDVVTGRVHTSEALERIGPHLSFLPAAHGAISLADPPPFVRSALDDSLASVKAHHEVVVLDLASGISRQVTDLAASADLAIVVLTPEPPAVAGAYALVKILSDRSGKSPSLLLNRVTPTTDALALVRRFHRMTAGFLDVAPPVLGVVAEDARVREAALAMTPLIRFAPRSRAAVSMRRVARKLLLIGTSAVDGQGFVARQTGPPPRGVTR